MLEMFDESGDSVDSLYFVLDCHLNILEVSPQSFSLCNLYITKLISTI